MLDEPTDETLHRSDQNPVEHDRAVRRVVGPGVLQAKSFGEIEIKCHRRPLPFPADCVNQLEIELRPVECPPSLVVREGLATLVQSISESLLRILPELGTPERLIGPGGELDRVGVAESLEHLVAEIEQPVDLVGYL